MVGQEARKREGANHKMKQFSSMEKIRTGAEPIWQDTQTPECGMPT